MSVERIRRLMTFATLSLLVVVHCIFLWPAALDAYRWSLLNALGEATPPAQAALLAALLVVGPGSWWLRIPVVVLLGIGVVAVTDSDRPMSMPETDTVIVMLLTTTGLTLLLAAVERLRGKRIRMTRADANGESAGQFSIRNLLVMTALAALVVWAGMQVRGYLSELRSPVVPAVLAHSVLAGLLSCVTLLATWTTLGGGRPWLGVPLVVVGTAVLGYAMPMVFLRPDDSLVMMRFVVCFTLVVSGTLLVLRAAGYRYDGGSDQPQAARTRFLVGR